MSVFRCIRCPNTPVCYCLLCHLVVLFAVGCFAVGLAVSSGFAVPSVSHDSLFASQILPLSSGAIEYRGHQLAIVLQWNSVTVAAAAVCHSVVNDYLY